MPNGCSSSLSNSFVEICNCTPSYADSFDLNGRHSQVSFAGIRCRSQVCASIFDNYIACSVLVLSDARTHLPRTPVRASVDARLCICQMPVPVSVRTGVGWKLYYDAYRIYMSSTLVSTHIASLKVIFPYVGKVEHSTCGNI